MNNQHTDHTLQPDDLKTIRRHLGTTIPDAAKRVGTSRVTWWRWEKGEVPVPNHKQAAILKLATEAGITFMAHHAPQQGEIAIRIHESQDVIRMPEAMAQRMFGTATCIALLVEGDAMEPAMRNGEMAIVDVTTTVRVDGIYAVVADGVPIVRRLHRAGMGKQAFAPDNPAYNGVLMLREEVEVLGRVVGAIRSGVS